VKSAGISNLLDPSGPLSKIVPSTSIEEANKEVATRHFAKDLPNLKERMESCLLKRSSHSW